MFRICNLAVKHFSLLQNDSDAGDYEGTCVMEILLLKKFQRFLYYKEMTAELQQNRKTANLKSFLSAGIHANEKSILHTRKYDAVLYFPF